MPSVVADLRRGRGAQLLTRLSAVLCAPSSYILPAYWRDRRGISGSGSGGGPRLGGVGLGGDGLSGMGPLY